MRRSRIATVVLVSLFTAPAFADRKPAIYTLDNPPPKPGDVASAYAPTPVPAPIPPAAKSNDFSMPPSKTATKHTLISLSGEGKHIQVMTDPSLAAPTLIPLVPQSAPAGSTIDSKSTLGAKLEWRHFGSEGNKLLNVGAKASIHSDKELAGGVTIGGGTRFRKDDGCTMYVLGGVQIAAAGKIKASQSVGGEVSAPIELGLMCVSGNSTFTASPMVKTSMDKYPGYELGGIFLTGGRIRYYDGNKVLLDLEGGPHISFNDVSNKYSGYQAKAGLDFKVGPFVTLGAKAAVSDRKMTKEVDGSEVRVQATELTGNVGLALP